jgi:hypothetical protein
MTSEMFLVRPQVFQDPHRVQAVLQDMNRRDITKSLLVLRLSVSPLLQRRSITDQSLTHHLVIILKTKVRLLVQPSQRVLRIPTTVLCRLIRRVCHLHRP